MNPQHCREETKFKPSQASEVTKQKLVNTNTNTNLMLKTNRKAYKKSKKIALKKESF
jgi:hypothetical protein